MDSGDNGGVINEQQEILEVFVKKYKEMGLSVEDTTRLWHFNKLKGLIRISADDLDNISSIYSRKEKIKGIEVPVIIKKSK